MRVLLIDDDPSMIDLIRAALEDEGHEVTEERDGDAGLKRIYDGGFDAVITDLQLPGLDGLNLVRQSVRRRPETPIVLITGFGTTDTAIEAMKEGAFDYITKPFSLDELTETVRRAADSAEAGEPSAGGGKEPVSLDRDVFIGNSKAMEAVCKTIGRVAAFDASVLISGETGTGKEMAARAIRQYSARADAPFVAVNCGAIPENLLESELFGHERGAFTGAEQRRIGRFEQADGGTLFLDEIGDMAPATQVKLLRFLQDQTIERLGSNQPRRLDLRIIAATYKDLPREVAGRRFREDLYYRLNVAHVRMPALRDRKDDIPLLLDYFGRRLADEYGCAPLKLAPEAETALRDYEWPGNVRQLENTVRQLLVKNPHETVHAEQVRDVLGDAPAGDEARGDEGEGRSGSASGVGDARGEEGEAGLENRLRGVVDALIDACERDGGPQLTERFRDLGEPIVYAKAMERTGGHQTRAAELLGVSMKTLRQKLRRYGLHPKS